jgi:hypothetical protein
MPVRLFAPLALVLALGACTGPVPGPAPIGWVQADLPPHSVVRDGVDCGGRWYVAGAELGPAGATRPAAWDSTDGRTWRGLTFEPLPGSYYGPQNVISGVACADDKVAMVGAKPGGAHGIPRVSTWRQRADGALAEVAAPFETYGGDSAVNVGHIAGGPDGFLIAGNRTTGAAVWVSPDGATFRLFENAPGLASDGGIETLARDAAADPDGRWVVVGGSARTGTLDQEPAIWLPTADAGWQKITVPSGAAYNELQRAVRLGADIVAVGPHGSTFGAWVGHGTTWAEAGTFGGAAGAVLSLAAAGPTLFALVQIGADRQLWRSADSARTWRQVPVPRGTPTAVAGRAGTVLLTADGHVWTAPV